MTSDRFRRVQALFELALDRAPEERAAFVAARCLHDPTIGDEVLELVAADAELDAFVDRSPVPSVPDPVHEPIAVGTELGGYVVQCELGRGGYGRVYRAVHPVIGKTVAIKVLHPQFSSSPEHAKRFVNEARAVNEIGHPDIINVFAFDETPDGCPYFVMDFVDGPTLQRWLQSRGPQPLSAALPLLRRLAAAVDAAHERGVVHRDLKPSNVLVLTDPDGTLRPKLVDFGIAKLLHDSNAEVSAVLESRTSLTGDRVIGTPEYMAPEQARGQPIDHRTDVYAFGVLVYRMLAGRLPFQSDDAFEILMQHADAIPEPPSRYAEGIGPAVDAVVASMLAKDREERPRSLGAAVDALERVSTPAREADAVPSGRSELVGPLRRARGWWARMLTRRPRDA